MPLPAKGDSIAQHGDYQRQAIHVSPRVHANFGDRGDTCDMIEVDACEIQFPSAVSAVSSVGFSSEAQVPTLPAAIKESASLDVGLSGQSLQRVTGGSNSFPALQSGNIYESRSTDRTISNVTTLDSSVQDLLSTTVSSADMHMNWETLFMPYRRNNFAVETGQFTPSAVTESPRNQAPLSLATIREGFSETCVVRKYSEDGIVGPRSADNTPMNNTSVWVCDVSM